MLLRVLGSLEIDGADGPESVGGPVPRRVLTALLTRPGQVVTVDALLDAAWGDEPPSSAERTLQSHLARLRESLASIDPSLAIERRDGGYRLVVDPGLVDAVRFEQLVGDAADQPPGDAVAGLREALALWREPGPYADLRDTAYPSAEAARLTELHGAAAERLTAALLDAGDDVAAAAEAEARLGGDPYRERLWELLVVALYRQGRQGDALEAYQRARRALDDGLGVEPGARLREIEAQVLAQDPLLLNGFGQQRRPCPYKGLARYDAGDADLYVGRERLVDELVAHLVDHRLVVVVGPSGAGKSSLVRAGLVPALAAGALPGSAAWSTLVVVPGSDPVRVIDEALAARPDVLVVDQAEEALLAGDGRWLPDVSRRVLAAVDSGTRVVLALRADFYGRLADDPALARRAGPATVLVAPPDDDELRRIVTEPASRVGLRVDRALADLVVAEVRGRPGALPVLSTALVRTWEHREGDALTVASYRSGGGVEAALQRVGEEAWAALETDEQRTACRRLLLRLAVDEDGSWVRRRARRSEIAAPGDVAAEAALAVLTDRRLVIARADDVEISHEALLTGWPRLLGWLDDGRAHAAVRERLAAAASEWDTVGRDESELYAGTRLQAALDTAAAIPGDITPLESRFLAESSARADRDLTAQRDRADREARGRRRTRAVAVGLAGALVLAAGAGGYAIHQQRQAESATAQAVAAASTADAGRLGALARTGGDYARALLYAVQAVKLDPTPQTESDLFATLERGDGASSVVRLPGVLGGLTYTTDGRSLLALTQNGELLTYPASGGIGTSAGGVESFAYPRRLVALPDGHVMAGTSRGPTVLDPASGAVVQAGVGGSPNLFALSTKVGAGVVAPQDELGYYTHEVVVGSLDAGAAAATVVPVGGVVQWLDSCGDIACVLTDTRHVLRVDLVTRKVISDKALPAGTAVDRFAASPDGTRIAVSTVGGQIEVVDPASGAVVESLAGGSRDVAALAFSPDGSQLVTRDFGDVLLWHLGSRRLPDRLLGHSGRVVAAAFAPDGTTLATAADDQELITWDLGGARRIAPVLTRGVTHRATTLWVSGTTAIVGESGGALQFVDLGTGAVADTSGDNPHLGADGIGTARTGRDGGPLVVVDGNALTTVWDIATHRSRGVLDLPAPSDGYAPDVWVSPDGSHGATLRSEAGPSLVDLATRQVGTPLGALPAARSAVVQTTLQGWSPDGRELLISRKLAKGCELVVVDAVTGVARLQAPIDGLEVSEVVEDPQGSFYAVAMDDGTVRFLDAHDGHVLAPATSAVGTLYNVSVSPDGRHVSATGSIPVVRIWDTRTFREVGTPVPLDVGASGARARFGPDGRVVVVSGDAVRTIEVDVNAWITRACREVGRTLTPDEWREVLPDRPYDPACT